MDNHILHCRGVHRCSDGGMFEVGGMKWTKKKFIKEFGEDPEDLWGPDWANYLEEWELN